MIIEVFPRHGYLVSPGVQIHHEVLGLGVSVAHLALVAVGVPGHALGHVPVVLMIMIIVIMIVMIVIIIVMMIVVMIGIMILMMIVILILMMIVVMIVIMILMMIVIMIILMIVPVVLVLGDELVALVTLWARPGL